MSERTRMGVGKIEEGTAQNHKRSRGGFFYRATERKPHRLMEPREGRQEELCQKSGGGAKKG